MRKYKHKMDKMTNKKIAEIRARHEAATPGPWTKGFISKLSARVCKMPHVGTRSGTTLCDLMTHEDAEFVAHARQDIPFLLDKLDETKTALDELIKLQSHYAELLNVHDGGKRRSFSSGDEWIARLRELKRGSQ